MVVIGMCRGERVEKGRAGGEKGYGRLGQEGWVWDCVCWW